MELVDPPVPIGVTACICPRRATGEGRGFHCTPGRTQHRPSLRLGAAVASQAAAACPGTGSRCNASFSGVCPCSVCSCQALPPHNCCKAPHQHPRRHVPRAFVRRSLSEPVPSVLRRACTLFASQPTGSWSCCTACSGLRLLGRAAFPTPRGACPQRQQCQVSGNFDRPPLLHALALNLYLRSCWTPCGCM